MEQLNKYLVPYLVSNLVFVCVIFLAFRKPFWARTFFILLFAWASCTNFITAMNHPQVYLEYAGLSFLESYSKLIQGPFSLHIQTYIFLIAAGQFLICLGFIIGNRWTYLACWGGILFGIAISPLGVGSAFPATVMMAIALFVLLKKYTHDPVWKIHQYQNQKDFEKTTT